MRILPVIVLSQFCCTSLWFAGNGVMADLVHTFALAPQALGHLTSAVQFGFIAGTLVFALFAVADRISPSWVFFISACLAALFNLATVLDANQLASLLFLRFMTGFFLAGIYPVGMKIAADYYDQGLGRSLGFLVGALVVGTAFPHLLKGMDGWLPWKWVLGMTSLLAVSGGLVMWWLVPDGPYRKPAQQLDFTNFFHVFKNKKFRAAASGYFGHMWELYAFWAFVPVMLAGYDRLHPEAALNVPLWSFVVIGAGGPACVLGGYWSQSFGVRRTAAWALSLSGLCCLMSPFLMTVHAPFVFLVFLIFWGMMVVADSPLFSTLVAHNAAPEVKGTALTMVNCLGFSITIVSIQLLNLLTVVAEPTWMYPVLALGPVLGIVGLYRQ